GAADATSCAGGTGLTAGGTQKPSGDTADRSRRSVTRASPCCACRQARQRRKTRSYRRASRSSDAPASSTLTSAGTTTGMGPTGEIAQELAQQRAGVPPRVGVVADVGDAGRRQVAGTDGQDLVLHRLGHPRINAVADDVIELPPRVVHVEDAGGPQVDVGQPQ